MTEATKTGAAKSGAAKGKMQLWGVSLALFTLMGALQAIYGPALPMLARETGRPLAEVSVVFTVHWLGSAAGVGAMFLLGQRITPRVVAMALMLGAGLLGAGLGWGVTLAGASLAGFGQGCAAVVFNPRLLAVFGARGPAMLSLINAVFGAGAIVAPMVLVLLGGAFGLVFLSLAIAFALLLPVAQDVGRAEVAPGQTSFRPDPVILAFGACGIGLEAALIGLGPAALVRSGATETQGAEAMSAFFMAFLLARLALTFVAHRIAPMMLYLLSVAGVALCMGLALLMPPYWPYVLSGGFVALVFQAYFVEGTLRMGHSPHVSPAIIAGGLCGGIGLPFVLAQVTEAMAPGGFFRLMAVLSVLVTCAAMASLMTVRRRCTDL